MQEIKNKYERNIIKLGNSKAITFPQEWTNKAKLEEKSVVSLYPIDKNTLIVRTRDMEDVKVVFELDSKEWPEKLIKQAIISAFKLNTDEVLIKYDNENQNSLYKLLIDLRREIIGFDFKDISNNNQYSIKFLLDSSKTNFLDVLLDLANVFHTIISDFISGVSNKNKDLLRDEIDRKYSLGKRILITGLSNYPLSKQQSPIIRFLGNRVVLLYIREFINQVLNSPIPDISIAGKYLALLGSIPELLIEFIRFYHEINLAKISRFHEQLSELQSKLDAIEDTVDQKCHLGNLIQYYLNSFINFFDIAITRLVEAQIGIT